jgi:hypothetical protein
MKQSQLAEQSLLNLDVIQFVKKVLEINLTTMQEAILIAIFQGTELNEDVFVSRKVLASIKKLSLEHRATAQSMLSRCVLGMASAAPEIVLDRREGKTLLACICALYCSYRFMHVELTSRSVLLASDHWKFSSNTVRPLAIKMSESLGWRYVITTGSFTMCDLNTKQNVVLNYGPQHSAKNFQFQAIICDEVRDHTHNSLSADVFFTDGHQHMSRSSLLIRKAFTF